MQSELVLKFQFEASHSLSGYEQPHPHLWKLELALGGQVIDGKILDMVEVRNEVDQLILPLKMTYLNDNSKVNEAVRKAPTCETLSQFFSEQISQVLKEKFHSLNPSVHLLSVMVTIGSMDGTELGGVRVYFSSSS